MSKQLVARALAELSDSRVLIRSKIIDEPIATLIRAVDEQYPEGYDEAGGFTVFGVWGQPEHLKCRDCFGRDEIGHASNCTRWHTRVALLALCRDIVGDVSTIYQPEGD